MTSALDPGPGVLAMRGIRKSFGETVALDGLDLEISAGTVLGIAGPNGAGKSTLIRILAGEDEPDSGEFVLGGAPWAPKLGAVAVVHQEPQLWPNLTVAENLLVGRESGKLAAPSPSQTDRDALEEVGILGFADRLLADCPLAVRQRVEIARALARSASIFLFDEPNSALNAAESDGLFAHMHALASSGRLVVLVTHRLQELVSNCRRVVVIRDGRVGADLSEAQLTEAAVARELVVGNSAVPSTASAQRAATFDRAPLLTLRGWTSQSGRPVDDELTAMAGEVLAVVGVEGSGARELVAAMAGQQQELDGNVSGGSIRSGGGATEYVTGDRRATVFGNLTVAQNLVVRLGAPDIASPGGFLRPARQSRVARDLVERYAVRTADINQPVSSLSGGNQQKVVIAAAVSTRPAVLVLEEPTRGVDISSKAEIYRVLRGFAANGGSVVVYCTELPEVFELADRMVVVRDGRTSAPFDVGSFPDVIALASAAHTAEGLNAPTGSPVQS